MQELISHSASILPVNDMNRMRKFYVEKLGFREEFAWEDPPSYLILSMGKGFQLHLSLASRLRPEGRKPFAYLFARDVDAVYSGWKENGVDTMTQPENAEYKMRDFEVVDPEGNVLVVGQSTG